MGAALGEAKAAGGQVEAVEAGPAELLGAGGVDRGESEDGLGGRGDGAFQESGEPVGGQRAGQATRGGQGEGAGRVAEDAPLALERAEQ
ncbi:hypothetical protein AB0I39_30515 [Kitasatospora purpeofusca]|uniref:hypothetical protein n=1 Tax=Kitasatospora purpeofusca TaxID=67352 RepID=UPI0033E7DD1A